MSSSVASCQQTLQVTRQEIYITRTPAAGLVLWFIATYQASRDVALVSMQGAGMVVSGEGQRTLRSDKLLLDSLGWLPEVPRIASLVLVSTTHLGLRVAPGGGAGVEDVDLVVPTPEPEQGVSDGGLAEKIQMSPTCLRDHVTTTCKVRSLTQDISATRKLADGEFCTSRKVLQP